MKMLRILLAYTYRFGYSGETFTTFLNLLIYSSNYTKIYVFVFKHFYVDKFKRLLYVESNAEMIFPPKK